MLSIDASAKSQPRGVVAITGTTGYIGRATARHFRDAGWTVIALSRADPAILGVNHIPWFLGADISIATIRPDIVIHLASATMVDPPGFRTAKADLKGLKKLLAQCRSIDMPQLRFVFISSQSARPDAANLYGRVKHAQETYLARNFEITIRPGL